MSISLKDYEYIELAKMNLSRDELGLSLGKNKNCIYAIGGYSGKHQRCLNEVERYDINKNQWTFVSPMNTPRRALTAVKL